MPDSPLDEAKALCLRVLAFHARTEAQLRRRLRQAGHADATDEVIAWLGRLGYLDDAAWARARARALLAPGRLGPRAAVRRLLAAGIPAAAARDAVEQALREGGEEAGGGRGAAELLLCRALAERKARAPLGGLDDRARARLARFLLGRGFAGEVVARVVGLTASGEG